MNNPQLAPEGEALLPCPLCSQQLQPAADHRMAGMLEHPAGLPLCPISALCFNDTPEMRALWNRRELGSTGAVATEPEAGQASLMPGARGFTMAVFRADEVPAGTKVYTHPAPADTGQGGRVEERHKLDNERPARPSIGETVPGAGWQPIETAPKDFSVIVAAPCDGHYIVGEARYFADRDSDTGWWWAGESPGDYYADKISPDPEFWQPLPSAPLAPTQEGEAP
jgi:hypothetical protein